MTLANLSRRQSETSAPVRPDFTWQEIDAVFLDMDGTLLDKHYDDYFWEQYVPETYARQNSLDPDEARRQLLAIYRSVENTLLWTDLDYWSGRLNLDIAALKREICHLVNIHPHVLDFFSYMHHIGKKLYLITNAHPKALQVKMDKVKLEKWFERLICSQEVGAAKEQPEFWQKLQTHLPYDKTRTLFADDTEKVLHSAAEYGIHHLIHIAKPSSRLLPRHSLRFPSILTFQELMF